jgi:hypothetical protein
MRSADLSGIPELEGLDQFLQWDLVTLNPWGVPVVAPVGARLVPGAAEIWTSTTVGYQAKVRNMTANPGVAMLRFAPGEPSVLVRGEASIIAGDGTANLGSLFRLMQGSSDLGPRFRRTMRDPLWALLYREYWHRILIRIRILEVEVVGGRGTSRHRIGEWRIPRPQRPRPAPGSRSSQTPHGLGRLDPRGRQMLHDGLPAILAVPDRLGRAPLALPARVRQDRGGRIFVHDDAALPVGGVARASLAVRALDDSFEMAQMVAWIGRLERGQTWREFVPRSSYGFAKPPGLLPDFAAGLAATLAARGPRPGPVTTAPRVAEAVAGSGLGDVSSALQLPETAWKSLERIFAFTNAAAPWYAAEALLTQDPETRGYLTYLAERAERERDWAHSLLLRGGRSVSPLTVGRGAIRARPRSLKPHAEAQRQDQILEVERESVRQELPPRLRGSVPRRLGSGPVPGIAVSSRRAGLGAAWEVATSLAALVDRIGLRK